MFHHTPEEQNILNAYTEVMQNPFYEKRGEKRFRILFFSYLFGCVHADQASTLFSKNPDIPFEQRKAERNKNSAFLNYLSSKNGYLKKLGDFYYTLSPQGVKKFFFDLTVRKLLPESYMDFFCRQFHAAVLNPFHACASGSMAASFHKAFSIPFLSEPMFSAGGERIVGLKSHFESCVVPDAAAFFPDSNETIYLECDCGTERINTRLLPKLQRYLSILELDPKQSIHFFLTWKEENANSPVAISPSQIQDLLGLYQLFSQYGKQLCPDTTLSFPDFLTLLKSYDGKSSLLFSLSSKLHASFPEEHIPNSMEEFLHLIQRQDCKQLLSFRKYATRRHSFTLLPERIPFLGQLLERGVRLFITPLSCSYELFPYLYISKYHTFQEIEHLLRPFCRNVAISSFHDIDTLQDPITGDSYTFRNVYSGLLDGNPHLFALENISEDLGGFLRVKKLTDAPRVNTLSNLTILCLYSRDKDRETFTQSYAHVKKESSARLFFYQYV